jgi:DNA-binding HxlR family transcriptional regulator
MGSIDESVEFLSKKGSGQLFTILDYREPTSFGEIREQILISESTLSSRLKEGRELGLFQNLQIPSDEEHGNVDPYVLTDKGKLVEEVFRMTGVTEHYTTILETRSLIDQKEEIIRDFLRRQEIRNPLDDEGEIPGWQRTAEERERNKLREKLIEEFEEELRGIDNDLVEDIIQAIKEHTDESVGYTPATTFSEAYKEITQEPEDQRDKENEGDEDEKTD